MQKVFGKIITFALSIGAATAMSVSSAADTPNQIRIGFQKSAINLVLIKQRGILEKNFPSSKITWTEFPAGPQLLEALSAGSLDFGLTGDAPPIFAQAAGKDVVYVGAEPPKPESSAILVPDNSPLKNLTQLKGKRIAVQKGSSSHFLLVRALQKDNLKWTDIDPAYLTPSEARAAFERGSVDAWVIWDPFYAAAELGAKARVLSSGTGLSLNNSFYLSSSEFARRYPETISQLLAELTLSDQYLANNRTEAAKLYSEYSGLNLGTVFRFISRRPVAPSEPLSKSLVQEQQRVADTFFELGLIPKKINVTEIVVSGSRK